MKLVTVGHVAFQEVSFPSFWYQTPVEVDPFLSSSFFEQYVGANYPV